MIELTFAELCEQSMKAHFTFPAIADYGMGNEYKYKDLAKKISELHVFFEACGVMQEDKIALIGKNDTQWCITYLAVITYGAVIVPILQDFSPKDIHNIIDQSDSILLFSTDTIWKNLQPYRPTVLRGVISLSGSGILFQQEKENLKALLASTNERFIRKYPQGFTSETINYSRIQKNKTAVISYTSGTTGSSKGVMITGDNLVGNLIFARQTFDLREGDSIVSLLPLAHAYGCTFEFLFPLMEGCQVILLGKTPSPQILLKAFDSIRPRLIIAVPLILEKIYKNMILPVINKPVMRFLLKIPGINHLLYNQICNKLIRAFGSNFIQIIVGGAPLNSEVEDFLLKIHFPVSVGYGMTECAPLISFSPYCDYVPHSAGKVLSCMNVRIDSPDPYQTTGEIQVKGQNVMIGYYKNKKGTQEAFTKDGWLRTGDLGTIDRHNHIFIRGRSKNVILSADGQNIYPEEIEAKLNNLPFVADSLVVERKNRLIALVYPDYNAVYAAGITDDDLKKVMLQNKETLNKTVASFEKIVEIQLMEMEFEKTPKISIKRFMYQ